jgi:sugar lactone lactonase YvrE
VDLQLRYARQPLHFEDHSSGRKGRQAFFARGAGYTLVMKRDEVELRLAPRSRPANRDKPPAAAPEPLRLQFPRGRLSRMTAADELPGRSHYFRGRNAAAWGEDVRHYGRVRYERVYPGVDVVFYGNQTQLEYDIVLAPRADLGKVQLAFKGATGLSLDGRGDLIVHTRTGDVTQVKPVVYQDVAGVRRTLDGRYVVKGRDRVGFEVAGYDVGEALVIDPVLRYSSYLGGSGRDEAVAIALDAAGNIYVAGTTPGIDFPVSGGRPYGGGFNDAFVTKLSADGSSLLYSTYLGGNLEDRANALAVDAAGAAYVAGATRSTDFPVVGGVQGAWGGGSFCGDSFSNAECTDAFVTKLAPDGSSLVYSTYLGGNDGDRAYGIAVDGSGEAIVAGSTSSPNLPTRNALFFYRSAGSFDGRTDGFLARLNAAGSALVFSTYYGGTRGDAAQAVALGPSGDIFLSGWTRSSNFPAVGALQGYAGTCSGWSDCYPPDAFAARLAADGSSIRYSTFIGGVATERAAAVVVDGTGSATIGGLTYLSSDFPLVNPLQGPGGYFDGFLTKLTPDGNALVYSTYLGGTSADSITALALGPDGGLYATGTAAYDFPSVNPLQPNTGFSNAFVTKLNAAGTALEFSTILGDPSGERWGQGGGIAVDAGGDVFIAGQTTGNLPIRNPYQPQWAGDVDGFVARLGRADNVQIERPAYRVEEYGGQFEVAVVRGDGGDYPVTVGYTTANGTATEPFDYQAVSGSLTLGPGETRGTIVIPVADDPVPEADETVYLEISILDPPAGVVYGLNRTAVLTIGNDDFTPPRGTATQSFVVRDRTRPTGPNWEAVVSVPWLTLSQYEGTGPSPVQVTADTTGLAVGGHEGTITITAPGADSPQVIQVFLQAGTEFEVTPSEIALHTDDPAGSGEITSVASLASPTAVAVDGTGALYVAEADAFRVSRVAADGTVTTVAGTGSEGDTGDGGPAIAAALGRVNGLATDAQGNLYIADSTHHRVRRVAAADGLITGVAGTGVAGYDGDTGPATAASLNFPAGLAFDAAGNLLIADARNNRIRRVDISGNIDTFAGSGSGQYEGDGGLAVNAGLSQPHGVAADAQGNVYIADTSHSLIRQVRPDGTIDTIAGGELDFCGNMGTGAGYDGDGEPALGSALSEPTGVAVDALGVVYVADTGNHRIRRIENGGIFSAAGTGQPAFWGDGGAAAGAAISGPRAVAVDAAGVLWIADTDNGLLRRVDARRLPVQAIHIQAPDGGPGPDWVASDDAAWLSVRPDVGTAPSDAAVTADGQGLAPGTYTATITVAGDEGLVARTASASLVVPSPALTAEPLALFFVSQRIFGGEGAALRTEASFGETTSLVLQIGGDPGPGNWQLTADAPWIVLSEAAGSSATTVTVSVDATDLDAGTYPATLTLTSDNGGVPRVIRVSLRVARCEGG